MRASSLKARAAAAGVVGAAVVTLVAGCNFISPQATTKQYDASDGTSVNVGDVQVRNAILLTEDGSTASLSMTVLNTGDDPVDVSFEYPTTSGSESQSVEVDGSAQVQRGTQPGQEQFVIDGLDSAEGALVSVFVQYGDQTGKSFVVPVLTGALSEYATLLPSPTPTTDAPVSGSGSTPLPQSTEDAPAATATP